jgi:hypothetical protein
MSFLGGALPNVMLIIGVLAIGLGLGIELKLVPLNKEIDKTGRIGAIIVGALLVVASLYIYLNPTLNNQAAAPTTANAALLPAATAPAVSGQAHAEAPTVPAAAAPAVPEPSATLAPTSAPEPSATPVPAAVLPTEVPSVVVPNVRNLSEKEARGMLREVGLEAQKADQCTGDDQGDSKVKKNRIACQNPSAEARVPAGSTVVYVLAK